ncbi:unannotated protein [freshwater metagenome]|uniref:Unannotated protein n=1 Tax=freshwater metagenome TaxID=449393 RepID=A0A6J7H1G2_9ZZZZ
MLRVAECVTRGGVFQSDGRVDVAGGNSINRVLFVCVHLEELSDALLLVFGRVDHLCATLGLAGVDANVGESTEERVRDHLERESGEGLGRCRLARDNLLEIAHVVALNIGNVERRGQVVDHGIEHWLHTAVLERRTTQHGVDLAVDGELANGSLDFSDRQVFATKELLKQNFVGLGDGLEQRGAVLVSLVDHVGGNFFNVVLGAQLHVTLGVSTPGECLHLNQVDNALKGVLGTDGKLNHERLGAQAVDDGVDREVEVGAQFVHFVNEANARNVILVGLTPHGF